MRPKLLFFVEGFTDIRFVTGLSEISELTLCVPANAYHSSGLKQRVLASGADLRVHEIAGGRLTFQWRSFIWLWQNIRRFDVVLSQELLRGSLNATVTGWLRHVPVVTTMALPPLEYFRCRQARGQIGAVKAFAGETAIRILMTVNGRLSTRCVVLGRYLESIASRYCPRTTPGGYYGVDTEYFKPATAAERTALRVRRNLPTDRFVVFLSSRISHEKDPETVLRAAALARARGLNVLLVNLSGGYKEFLAVARELGLGDVDNWIVAQDAVHPMLEVADYFKLADVVVQASHAEGLGLSTLEGLACGTPVVATAVGGMKEHLKGFARLTPPGDAEAMADAFLAVAAEQESSRAQALQGREMVKREWSREKSFRDLAFVLQEVTAGHDRVGDCRPSESA